MVSRTDEKKHQGLSESGAVQEGHWVKLRHRYRWVEEEEVSGFSLAFLPLACTVSCSDVTDAALAQSR